MLQIQERMREIQAIVNGIVKIIDDIEDRVKKLEERTWG
jgi:hypothetical protein